MVVKQIFAMTLSGNMTMDLKNPQRDGDDLARVLHRLNGQNRFSIVLFQLPPGKDLDQVDVTAESGVYLQCAGSAERLTLEQRVKEGGDFVQYVLGTAAPAAVTDPAEVVTWNSFEVMVHASEVFTAADAEPIFRHYLQTVDVPAELHRRRIIL